MKDQPLSDASSEIPSPALVAAWRRLGILDIDRVPKWAAYWLIGGYDGPALARLAGVGSSDSRETQDLLPAAPADCGIALPLTTVAAAETVFNDLIEQLLSGQIDEGQVIQEVDTVLHSTDYAAEVRALPLGKVWDCIDQEWTHGRTIGDGQRDKMVRAVCKLVDRLDSGTTTP